MRNLLFALLIGFPLSALAQSTGQTLSIGEPRPITFQVADSAKTLERPDGRFMIITEGLEAQTSYGVMLPVENPEVTWIEVYPNGTPPAKVLPRLGDGGDFLIDGDAGQEFLVRVPNGWDPPKWLTVTLPGKPAPPPPPPIDEGMRSLSAARANALDDPATRARIKEVIKKQVELLSQSPTPVDKGVLQMVGAIEDVLASRPKELQDVLWKPGWRTPIGKYIQNKGYDDLQGYLSLMTSAAEGL